MNYIISDLDTQRNSLLGSNVKWFREKAGLTQEELGKRINYKKPWVSRLENHQLRTAIKDDLVVKIAKELDTSADILLCTNDPINSRLIRLDNGIRLQEPLLALISEADALVDLAQHYGPRIFAESLRLRANLHLIGREHATAQTLYEQALFVADEHNDSIMSFKVKQNISNLYLSKMEYNKAEEMLLKDIPHIQHKILLAEDLRLLGLLYCRQGNFEKAERTLLNAISESQGFLQASQLRAECYQYLGNLYLDNDEYELSIRYAKEAKNLASQIEDKACEFYALKTIADALVSNNEREKAVSVINEAEAVLPPDSEFEKKQLDFLKLFASCNTDSQYKDLKAVAVVLEKFNPHPLTLVKVYDRITQLAFELKNFEDAQEFHKKTVQKYRTVLS